MNKKVAELIRSRGLHMHISEDCQRRMDMLAMLIVEECIFACATDRLGKTAGAEELIRQHFGIE